MGGDWRVATVIELQREGILLVEDGNHGENRPRSDEFGQTGVAFVRAADMDGGRVLFEFTEKINEEAQRRITKGIGARGDVLLTHKGTVGKVALVADDAPPFVCSPQTTFWRVLDEKYMDRRYLYAFLRSPSFHAQLATRSGETDMAPYVSLTSQRGLSVTLPPLDEQRAIAHILGTLDDKIELNRRMSQTLEEMARALFQSWFVDFDPMHAKAEGRWKKGQTLAGMPAEMWDLWPDSFEESELGPIPKGWTVGRLSDIADFLNGLALQKFPPSIVHSIPVIKIAQLRKDDTTGADRCSPDIPPEYIVDDGDVIFSWSGSLECAIWTGGRGALNQHLFKVTSDSFPQWFYYLWIHHHLPDFRHIAASKATTMGHIQRHHLDDAGVVLPIPAFLNKADKLFSNLMDQACSRRKEARLTENLRDALLPKLISGELRVQAAEKFLKAVGAAK